ncbi:MAG: DUF427 domain-containing protein [Pirellulaceae bacterium]
MFSGKRPRRIEPGPGEESVWDYPRPPMFEAAPSKVIRIVCHGVEIARTNQCWRMLETSHPPVYYIPISEIQNAELTECAHQSWCEWKGQASYIDVLIGQERVQQAGWFYANPNPKYKELHRKIAFYPSKIGDCYVNDELVQSQAGDFYGGWITADIVGPFKGELGTRGW